MSGRYIALYILPPSLYTKTSDSLIYLVAISNIEVKEMTTTVTQQQVAQHNKAVIARLVAQHIWAQTSRVATTTRHSQWSR